MMKKSILFKICASLVLACCTVALAAAEPEKNVKKQETAAVKTEKKAEPNLAQKLNMKQMQFKSAAGTLNYCQALEGEDLPGKYSLVLFFHGAGECGDDNAKQLIHGIPQLLNYVRTHGEKTVVIAPQCPRNKMWVNTPWNQKSHSMPPISENMALAVELLKSKCAEFNVDPQRIYVTGVSMGGYGTWDIISRFPDYFAAAVPVCGGADLAFAKQLVKMPLMVYHGEKDYIVPTIRSRNMVKALKEAGSTSVQYHEVYKCGHGVWVPAYNDSYTWEWLFQQKRDIR